MCLKCNALQMSVTNQLELLFKWEFSGWIVLGEAVLHFRTLNV